VYFPRRLRGNTLACGTKKSPAFPPGFDFNTNCREWSDRLQIAGGLLATLGYDLKVDLLAFV
jgi:hypothetical protein